MVSLRMKLIAYLARTSCRIASWCFFRACPSTVTDRFFAGPFAFNSLALLSLFKRFAAFRSVQLKNVESIQV
jgi:hypothetical protein